MLSTMNLLERAVSGGRTLSDLSRGLGLNPNALHASKGRGHLSPAIAGALAEELGEDVLHWVAVAALESEKDSACKDRMLKRMGLWRKRSVSIPPLPFRVRKLIEGWSVPAFGFGRSLA